MRGSKREKEKEKKSRMSSFKKRRRREMRDWSVLPEDLLIVIAKQLENNIDYLAFRATCKSWRSATKDMPLHYPKQLPLLLIPDDGENPKHRAFSLSDNKTFRLKPPSKAQQPRFFGSSNGWLVAVDECLRAFQWNPFTKAQIELPPLTTFPEVAEFVESKYYQLDSQKIFLLDDIIRKVAISSDPALDLNYIVVIIYGREKKVAFCKHEDKEWRSIVQEDDEFYYEDIVHYNKHFYIVDAFGSVKRLSFHPSPQLLEVIQPIFHCFETPYRLFGLLSYTTIYLVEWRGHLLVVRKCYFPHTPSKFEVFQIDFQEATVYKMKSIGDYSLFLSRYGSASLSARAFPGLQRDCIYFTEVKIYEMFRKDRGVYNMKDESIMPLPWPADRKFAKCLFCPHLLWLYPTCRHNEILEMEANDSTC